MDNKYLLMWLEGPMQSWGSDSRFNRRESLEFPTKSAICGIICAAMGAKGPQTDLLYKLISFPMTVIGYGLSQSERKDSSKISIKKPSRLMDFHMVGSGYGSSPWEEKMIPKKEGGEKTSNTSGAKLTYRYYLEDAAFGIILEMDDLNAQRIAEALQNPKWFNGLGRKNCIPTEWIYQGVFENINQAKEKANQIASSRKENYLEKFPRIVVREGSYPEEGTVLVLSDIPICFGEYKKYATRTVTVIDLTIDSDN